MTLQATAPAPAAVRAETTDSAPRPAAGVAGRVLGALAGALVVLWAVATLTFFLLRLIPGDPVLLILGTSGSPSAAVVAATRAAFGLDQPVLVQYLHFLAGAAHGDFGISYQLKVPVTQVIGEQLLATVQLVILAVVLAWALSLAITVPTAGRRPLVERTARTVEIVLASLPQFWIGIMLLVVLAIGLGWFPVAGGDGLAGLFLPALTLAIPIAGFLSQVMRESFETALKQPFVTSARARGAGEARVRLGHALRHALLPGVTLTGWAVGSLFSGAVVVEVIFARPGIGRVLLSAVLSRDIPVVLGVVVVIAAVYVVVNAIVDILYPIIDPRLASR
ncbi:ABC transporter permease [Cryobacterium tepidiphilum]|uniref:ABC transporter permease n=1 Tax=Cryobacterium tepidiphilum TaxID=2486026 RepID=A0A3M8LF61_9MICO|nr:ABC transporter permease [Cryobacterium tepidiphilum]RNE64177.1 ABC transporter permease [Cryobacterium tepidiphilum]